MSRLRIKIKKVGHTWLVYEKRHWWAPWIRRCVSRCDRPLTLNNIKVAESVLYNEMMHASSITFTLGLDAPRYI